MSDDEAIAGIHQGLAGLGSMDIYWPDELKVVPGDKRKSIMLEHFKDFPPPPREMIDAFKIYRETGKHTISFHEWGGSYLTMVYLIESGLKLPRSEISAAITDAWANLRQQDSQP